MQRACVCGGKGSYLDLGVLGDVDADVGGGGGTARGVQELDSDGERQLVLCVHRHWLCTAMKDGVHSARQPHCNAYILIYIHSHTHESMYVCMHDVCAHIRIICVCTHRHTMHT